MVGKTLPDAERIEELLGRYVEQHIVGGVVPDPEELCRSSPELVGPLKEYIREYEQLNLLLVPPEGLTMGRTLLHYRIVEKLGEGGMGQVYLAEDTKLGRRVALKLLPPEMAADPERFRRFQREARLAADLSHPNVVTIFSVEETEGLPFITMERVEGKTLADLVISDGWESGQILEVAEQLVDALVATHEHGIIHRDLKPANVMVGSDGRLKVLDFGLAKHRAAPDNVEDTLTVAGHLLGTLPYISPEQLQGRPVDPRTDIFSFGVIVYEMATGRRPFRGNSAAELISAILRDTPAPVTEINPRLPGRLGPIVRRCLEKDPEKRYPSAAELRHDLKDLRRELAVDRVRARRIGPGANLARIRPGARFAMGALVAALLLAGVSAGILQWTGRLARDPPPPNGPAKPSVAVLNFHNLAADAELDWLRTGLNEMLVTDLSQSPEIDVVATDRLYRILRELGAVDTEEPSFELLEQLAERAGVDTVLQGSFIRRGEELRIHFKIRAAGTGEILTGDRVDGRFETALFSMVDDLSRTVRRLLEVPQRAELAASVEQITTSSLDAWRYFSEGVRLQRQSKYQEAIPLLEKAVEVDPDFALALVNLGILHGNLRHAGLAREYTRRAVDRANHLPLNRRFFVEGRFFGNEWQSYGQAIEAYRRGLELFPDDKGLRGNLAPLYVYWERYEEAIREYQEIIDRGSDLGGTYADIASAHAAMGRFETGYRILSEFARRHPADWYGQLGLGWHLTQWGRLEEAFDPIRRAGELRPGDILVHNGWWRLRILREDWEQAALEARKMVELAGPYGKWRGLVCAARTELYGGRSAEALARLEESVRAYPEPEARTALSHCWAARILLRKGEPGRALVEAQEAQQEAPGEWPELEGMFLAALAQQALGRPAEADRLAAALRERAAANPNAVEDRQIHHLAGRLALARGEDALAVQELRAAVALLPPRGVPFHWHALPDHVPLWYALGEAELAAGRVKEARDWFRRVAESGVEHLEHPVLYVRSFYHLGKIHDELGEEAPAAAAYARFLGYWRDGDLDREQTREAAMRTAVSY